MTPDGKQEFGIQLVDAFSGENIITAGGTVFVATAGTAQKATLSTKAGASMSNPFTPTRGHIEFWIDLDIATVDLYIMAPGGQFVVKKGVAASGANEIHVDTASRNQCMVIPVAHDDVTANTETATGFTEPANAVLLPNPFIVVNAIDATETLDVGTDSGDSGDADGFLDGISVATAGVAVGTLTQGSATLGVLFSVQDSANGGDLVPEGHVSTGKSITVTTSAGSDTVEAFVHLPYLLAA